MPVLKRITINYILTSIYLGKKYYMKKLNTKKAFEYYCKGLNSKEIAKLLNCSFRTVQNYMSAENWKEKRLIINKNKNDR